MLGFGFGSRLFKVLIILGPGQFLAPGARFEGRVLLAVRDRFWLREPALKEEFNYISGPGPFLAPGARFEGRVSLAVRDRSEFGTQFCKRSVINDPGRFVAPGAGFERGSF